MEHKHLLPFTFSVRVPAIIYMTDSAVTFAYGLEDGKTTEEQIELQNDLVSLIKKHSKKPCEKYKVFSAIRYDGRKEIVLEAGIVPSNASEVLDVIRVEVPLADFEALNLHERCLSKAVDEHELRVPLYSFSGLVKRVYGWSTDRGIIENGKWFTQGTKLYEELGEVPKGIATNRDYLIQDGVGDALVVLVNIVALRGLNLESLTDLYNNAMTKVIENPNENGICAHRLYHNVSVAQTKLMDAFWNDIKYPMELIQDYLEALLRLTKFYEMDMIQCFSLAWDEIKNRRGWLSADGIFIKA